MMVTFDGGQRAWVENVFPKLDEFWICLEKDKQLVFTGARGSQNSDVRTFRFEDLVFIGEWSKEVEIEEILPLPSELMAHILGVDDWESNWEERTDVVVQIEQSSVKGAPGRVLVGPGFPPKVRRAAQMLKTHLDEFLETRESSGRLEVPGGRLLLRHLRKAPSLAGLADCSGVPVGFEEPPSRGLPGSLLLGPAPAGQLRRALEELGGRLREMVAEAAEDPAAFDVCAEEEEKMAVSSPATPDPPGGAEATGARERPGAASWSGGGGGLPAPGTPPEVQRAVDAASPKCKVKAKATAPPAPEQEPPEPDTPPDAVAGAEEAATGEEWQVVRLEIPELFNGKLGVQIGIKDLMVHGFIVPEAESHGWLPGDTIVAVNNHPVGNQVEFFCEFNEARSRLPFSVTVERGRTADQAAAWVPQAARPAAEPVARYKVDNSALGAERSVGQAGLAFRKTKHPLNLAVGQGVTWGSVLEGVDEGDGWFRESRSGLYLPMMCQGFLVLFKEAPARPVPKLPGPFKLRSVATLRNQASPGAPGSLLGAPAATTAKACAGATAKGSLLSTTPPQGSPLAPCFSGAGKGGGKGGNGLFKGMGKDSPGPHPLEVLAGVHPSSDGNPEHGMDSPLGSPLRSDQRVDVAPSEGEPPNRTRDLPLWARLGGDIESAEDEEGDDESPRDEIRVEDATDGRGAENIPDKNVDEPPAKDDDADQTAFQRGWEAAMKTAKSEYEKEVAMKAAKAETEEGFTQPDASHVAESGGEAATGAVEAAGVPAEAGASPGAAEPLDVAAASGPADVPVGAAEVPACDPGEAEQPSAGAGGGGEGAGRQHKTVKDWADDQQQFSDLPPLPENWIRVRSSGGGRIYYVNTSTGETTFVEPDGLPPGWQVCVSKSTGRKYYWHQNSNQAQFDRPTK